jgi:hypothetical protein
VRGRTAQDHTAEGKGKGGDGGDRWGGEGERSRFPKAQVCIRERERDMCEREVRERRDVHVERVLHTHTHTHTHTHKHTHTRKTTCWTR